VCADRHLEATWWAGPATGAEAGEPAQTYSEADIPCGATLRVPVVTDVTGVTIRASGPVGAEWEATIVTPDWQPSVTTFG